MDNFRVSTTIFFDNGGEEEHVFNMQWENRDILHDNCIKYFLKRDFIDFEHSDIRIDDVLFLGAEKNNREVF